MSVVFIGVRKFVQISVVYGKLRCFKFNPETWLAGSGKSLLGVNSLLGVRSSLDANATQLDLTPSIPSTMSNSPLGVTWPYSSSSSGNARMIPISSSHGG
ncbi:hypothetical protein THICB2_110020 [Thiomonas sp. CB2]|nr:hypothetical protein THICB2_110020 [Thiomonas sp. CB2]VDY05973.1 protein of unknown function [Thiomonas sp. Bio17B3]VDY10730.1 protein of unknown function [Thiomonas sp. Sup16B3]VDY14234.1 conserved protein of unknown function [Thiomonas sp. OC7]VDY16570.1 protein of unknown function [Thiomonas sp. CB2]